MSNVKITRSDLIMTKAKDALHKARLKTAPSKNSFQKNIPILLFSQKIHFKKHSFNCYKLIIGG